MLDRLGRFAWAQDVECCNVSGATIGIPTAKDPEHGNGQIAPEEVRRVGLECEHIEEFNAQDMADKPSEIVKSLQQQEEIEMNNQQHRSNDKIDQIKKDMKKMSDDKLRSIFAAEGDREISMLAHIELLSRANTPIVYEVKAIHGDEEDGFLKRAISSEYIDYLLDRYEEVRIRKVEIE